MAKKGLGTTITIDGQAIGILTSISGPEFSADTIDTTTLDVSDNHRTFMQSLIDPGEVTVTGYFDNTDAGHTAVKSALDNGTVSTYVITFPSTVGASWTFTGFVTKFKAGDATLEDPLTFEATFKISGKPTLGTSASTGISALTIRKADDSGEADAANYMPTFATGTYYYAVTFTTQTSVRPRVTAASHTIKMYVDGVYTETLTSGVSGSAIAIDADASKTLRFEVYESGKTPKNYHVVVARIS